VPKLYAHASASISTLPDRHLQEKLDKLVGVWESSDYFDANCQKQIRKSNLTTIIANEQSIMAAEQQRIAVELQLEMEATLKGYEKQHLEYEKHILTKIAQLEAQVLQREREEAAEKQAIRGRLESFKTCPSNKFKIYICRAATRPDTTSPSPSLHRNATLKQ